jgi:molybdate transport system substrate-binding protein
MRSRFSLVLAFVALAAAACSGSPSPATSGASPAPVVPSAGASASGPAQVDLTIYGAASLQGVLAKVKAAYEAAVPGMTLTISTDSSAALETKIELGAPADVFLSADTTNPKKLVDKGLAAGDAVAFANNQLVVIVPASNPAVIASPADLAKPGIKVIAAGDSVPITKYATQLIANLAREPGYPANFVAAYTANIASREDNVKAAVAKVELGEGDAAIVYVTDARASTKVTTVGVPDSANVPATYAGVVVKGSANSAAAKAFLAWLAGPDSQAIFRGFGFLPPS